MATPTTLSTSSAVGVHAGQPILVTGEALDKANAAMILIHGRGASARDILSLVPELDVPGFAYIAPQAAGGTWYPYSFREPLSKNEPNLSSALSVIDALVAQLGEVGIPPEKIMLLGFSQGACLSATSIAQHAQRYGGLAVLSGALIGPDDSPHDYPGSLDGTPIFLGCSTIDFHIPRQNVEASAEVLKKMGGDVTLRLYPNMDHTINEDEVRFVQDMMRGLAGKS
jgi:phospholipase/carboxylesterase